MTSAVLSRLGSVVDCLDTVTSACASVCAYKEVISVNQLLIQAIANSSNAQFTINRSSALIVEKANAIIPQLESYLEEVKSLVSFLKELQVSRVELESLDLDLQVSAEESSVDEQSDSEQSLQEETPNTPLPSKRLHSSLFRKKRWPCPDCPEVFRFQKDLIKHKPVHRIQREAVQCRLCNEMVPDEDATREHYKRCKIIADSLTSLPFCPLCNKDCSKTLLTSHLQLHPSLCPYQCAQCNDYFLTEIRYLNHLDSHVNRNECCTICNKVFPKYVNLQVHYKSFHVPYVIIPCDICGQLQKGYHRLKHHKERTHKALKRHLCDQCGASFANRKGLKVHKGIHKEVKPYVCEACGKGFAQKSTLDAHMNLHTKRIRYTCQGCKRTFFQAATLCTHKKKCKLFAKKVLKAKTGHKVDTN